MLNTDFWLEKQDPLTVGLLGGTPFPSFNDPSSIIKVNGRTGVDYEEYLRQQSLARGLDPTITWRQISRESGFDANATGTSGEQGIAQFMPATARKLGLRNPYDAYASIDTYTEYMAYLVRKYGSYDKALAAYNTGEPNVDKAIEKGNWWARIVSSTRDYVVGILGKGPDGLNGDYPVSETDSTVEAMGVDRDEVPTSVMGLFTDAGFTDVIARLGIVVLAIVLIAIGMYLAAR